MDSRTTAGGDGGGQNRELADATALRILAPAPDQRFSNHSAVTALQHSRRHRHLHSIQSARPQDSCRPPGHAANHAAPKKFTYSFGLGVCVGFWAPEPHRNADVRPAAHRALLPHLAFGSGPPRTEKQSPPFLNAHIDFRHSSCAPSVPVNCLNKRNSKRLLQKRSLESS